MALNIEFFHEKSKKKLKIFKIFKFSKILEKIEFSKKNFKLQIALKNSLFELWPKKKFAKRFYHEDYISKKIIGARALPRAARAESHIAVKTQKSWFFGIGGRIFCLVSKKTWFFGFSQRYEIERAPRAEVRARPNFF